MGTRVFNVFPNVVNSCCLLHSRETALRTTFAANDRPEVLPLCLLRCTKAVGHPTHCRPKHLPLQQAIGWQGAHSHTWRQNGVSPNVSRAFPSPFPSSNTCNYKMMSRLSFPPTCISYPTTAGYSSTRHFFPAKHVIICYTIVTAQGGGGNFLLSRISNL